jgi:predicted O-methyltransferase YrrM
MIFKTKPVPVAAPPAPAAIDPKGPLPAGAVLPQPDYASTPGRVEALCFRTDGPEWYPAAMLGASSLAAAMLGDPDLIPRAKEHSARLQPDDYLRYLIRFYEDGLRRFGAAWRYADIVTVLLHLSASLKPRRYLEIGVRRGRSACAVAAVTPAVDMVLCDLWQQNYAGMENPGPDHVRRELAAVGHQGAVEFLDGNSHETLPSFFREHPDAFFDIVTVDGDHTNLGAAQDLADVLPRINIGGALVFDDVCHPKHPGLRDVWTRLVGADRRFTSWMYDEAGYGVAFAIRRW